VPIELSSNDTIVVGPPSVLSSWGFDLIRAAAAQLKRAEIHLVDRNDEVEEVLAARNRPTVFCLSQYASPSLTDVIRNARVPAIAFLDDPIDSVRYLKEVMGCSFLESLRVQTAAATVCHALFDNPSVLLINRSTSATTGQIAAHILDHLRIGMTTAAIGAFIDEFVGEPEAAAWPLERALSRLVAGYASLGKASSITAEDATVVDQVLTPMMLKALQPDVGSIC
jgi:hypothetical protein